MTHEPYPRTHRLRREADFKRVLRHGRIYPGREILVRILESECGHPRLGIAAPRRFGKAVRRNRFRRLVREAFRRLELGSVDVMVSPRKGLGEPTLAGMLDDLRAAPRAARPQRARSSRPARKEKGAS